MTETAGRRRVEDVEQDDVAADLRYPFLEKLRPQMETIIDDNLPSTGRFCGNCYAGLRADAVQCSVCGASAAEVAPADEIPIEVLRLYFRSRKIERRWVYGMAFVGLIIASLMFVSLAVWGPGFLGHPAFLFGFLLFGGYALGRYFGEVVGGSIGVRKAIDYREEKWEDWVRQRGQSPA